MLSYTPFHIVLSGLLLLSTTNNCKVTKRIVLDATVSAHYVLHASQVLLEPSRQYLQQWLTSRQAQGVHFMPATLLESQLNTLKYNVEELYMHFRPDPVTGKFPSSDEMVEDIVRHIAASNATATDSKAAS